MQRRWLVGLVGVALLLGERTATGESDAKQLRQPRGAVLVDASSGRVLREQGADVVVASGDLGYLMIALLVNERIEGGVLSSSQALPASEAAVTVPGSQLALKAGDEVAVEELLRALVVAGASDAVAILAEAVAGAPEAAVAAMNERARALGMSNTSYGALSGGEPLPGGGLGKGATSGVGQTSARDTARLAAALLRFPRVSEWGALDGIPFRGGSVLLRNRNPLVNAVAGVDGLLAAQTRADGFHLVATARRGALHLVAVVLGAQDNASRCGTAAKWLEWGFETYDRIEIVRSGDPVRVPVHVRAGVEDQLVAVAAEDFSVLRHRGEEHRFEIGLQLPDVLSAPVARNQRVGEIIVREHGRVIAVVPAVSPAEITVSDGLRSATPPLLMGP